LDFARSDVADVVVVFAKELLCRLVVVKDNCVSWLLELCVVLAAMVVLVNDLEPTGVSVGLVFDIERSALLFCEDVPVEVRCLRELGLILVEVVVLSLVKVDPLDSALPPPWSWEIEEFTVVVVMGDVLFRICGLKAAIFCAYT